MVALLLSEVSDGSRELAVGDPVAGVRFDGAKPALDLVLSLSARVESRKVVLYTILNTLIVTSLEMKTVVFLLAAPVAAIQRIARPKK